MRPAGQPRAAGRWQLAVFSLSLVLAAVVWGLFPEPEESREGYTASGCYARARQHFAAALASRDIHRRSALFAAAIKYLRALEKRFGVSRSRWDAYEMLGDARVELAGIAETDRDISSQLRLQPSAQMRAEALHSYREALARRAEADAARGRLQRKEAEVLLALGRPEEALDTLSELVRRHRSGDVERLRQERETGVPTVAAGKITGELADEVRAVYFLTGTAALAAKREAEGRVHRARQSGSGEESENQLKHIDRYADDARRAFRGFLRAGGAGERKAAAETALGNLAFERAARMPPGTARAPLLEEARTRYAAAGTSESAFLLGRALFALGDYEAARRRFVQNLSGPPAERRARRYMVARCQLAQGNLGEARRAFAKMRTENPDDAEAAAALVGLAEVEVQSGDPTAAARYLIDAVRIRARAGGEVVLPERDGELEDGRLARRLLSLADAFEERGMADRAIELYRQAAEIDPSGPRAILRRIALALEGKARTSGSTEPLIRAGETYLELAGAVKETGLECEARRTAAERFAAGGALARAIRAAREFLRAYPDHAYTSRMMHKVGAWEQQLGLASASHAHLTENISTHPRDVYADSSRIVLARGLAAEGTDEHLAQARRVLRDILEDRRRYDARALVRLDALFLLGQVDLQLAESACLKGRRSSPETVRLLGEALQMINTALTHTPDQYPAAGEKARPLFAELVRQQRPMAQLARGEVLYLLAGLETDPRRRREKLEQARRDLVRSRGEGPGKMRGGSEAASLAALYEALASCEEARDGVSGAHLTEEAKAFAGTADEAWAYTCAALALLRLGDARGAAAAAEQASKTETSSPPSVGLLQPAYWRSWSRRIALRATKRD